MANENGDLKGAMPKLVLGLRNSLALIRNYLAGVLPGERPRWLVLELSGSYPARRQRRKFVSPGTVLGTRQDESLEEFAAKVTAMLRADWLEGVVLRFGQLEFDLTTAYALRNQLQRLKLGGKRLLVVTPELTNASYFLATAADEIVAPESADISVLGIAFRRTFMADALGRFGLRFEKLAIEEFKNAGDELALPAMSEAQRAQLDALLDSLEGTYLKVVGEARGRPEAQVREWIDRGVSSADSAKDLGMIDRVAYEDEVLTRQHKPFGAGVRFLPAPVFPSTNERVAVVSLLGTIITGKSRNSPLPLPLFGPAFAGSETLIRALRAAGKDATTAAVVFHVDSGGGSALASDLIWREVMLLARRKPVVAVMGQAAASGGYYVLTHATRVLAAPTTITGSIGVLIGKLVLEEFNRRYGFNAETLERGRFASISESASGWNEAERELLNRYNREIYGRFTSRVAEGRGLTVERVNEIGRGRIWSGADALELGLVDELGDVELAIVRAKELAGLHPDAPVWNVQAPNKPLLPSSDDPTTLLRSLAPLLRERALLMEPKGIRLR